MPTQIFLSYPRALDERSAVSDTRNHLERELRIKTGERDLEVFQDKAGIKGGDPWSTLIEEKLDQAAVFIIFLCPLWLTSDYCVKELRRYNERGSEGHGRPVLPLLWETTVPKSTHTPDQAALLRWINERQHVDWRTLRHKDSRDLDYRQKISELADAVAQKLPEAV